MHLDLRASAGRRLMVMAALLSAVFLLVAVGSLAAQAANAKPATTKNGPRTPDGHPDLQGTWSFATLTPLERPRELADKAVLTDEEVSKLEKQAVENQFVDRPPPPGNPGAYNRFWVDFGTRVNANRRTSLVIDPPDGRVPALTAAAQKREDDRAAVRHLAYGPEALPSWDRCILGFNAGPPILPSGYNNNLQLFQTRDYVAILTEMVHDTRVVPLDGRQHVPGHLRQWKGDSRGRWEGDTLVVETTNFTDNGTGTLQLDPEFTRRGLGGIADERLRLIERFTRVDADTLLYEFTVDDPTVWTRPWTAAIPMAKTNEQLYEYACHEGNYGMHGILAGARAGEKAR
ncbi:MAG: hypothetical protein DMF90_19535 [Acidobacteria bacterium]|nr:MAG: hypothetical protein DMF90_19535 [Acidobacteriota bacterium]